MVATISVHHSYFHDRTHTFSDSADGSIDEKIKIEDILSQMQNDDKEGNNNTMNNVGSDDEDSIIFEADI